MHPTFYVVVGNDDGPEVWGPYPTREDASAVISAYVAQPNTACIHRRVSLPVTGRPE